MMKKNILLIILICFVFLKCSSPVKEYKNSSIKFAIIANTNPESPYRKFNSKKIIKLINQLNLENPFFTIHMGNMIYGGTSKMGLKDSDIHKQFKKVTSMFERLTHPYYLVIGEKDNLNYSADIMLEYIPQKNAYHILNYGNLHLVFINAYQGSNNNINSEQFKWLKQDLKKNSNHRNIYLFANQQINKITINNKKSNLLTDLVRQYKIKAVFSSTGTRFIEQKIKDTKYINTATQPAFKRTSYYRFDYYIVEISGDKIKVTGKRLNR